MSKWPADLDKLVTSLSRAPARRLLVIGDIMLDRYVWGCADRVSPEAPVLVLRAEEQEARLGGAVSVASLLVALGANVALAGVVGADADSETLMALLPGEMCPRSAILTDPSRPTTCKQRYMGRADGRHAHQILRVDRECSRPLDRALEARMLAAIGEHCRSVDAILVSDYGKGVCTPALLAEVIRVARHRGIPLIVDPARGTDWQHYRHASIVKPNRAEAEFASGRRLSCLDDTLKIAADLRSMYDLQATAVTVDCDGMVIADALGAHHVPTRQRAVYDVTGAGDMALAMLGICAANDVPLRLAAPLANLAAGLEVERWGVTPVRWPELHRQSLPVQSTSAKHLSLAELSEQLDASRLRGARIVFTNGCFDLLHVGHMKCLQEAARLGDVLVVAINGDASVRRLKGPPRPVLAAEQRAAMVAVLDCVDHVTIFEDDTPHRLLKLLRPDVLVKGGTYAEHAVVGAEIVKSYGGVVRTVGTVNGISTTSLLAAAAAAAPRLDDDSAPPTRQPLFLMSPDQRSVLHGTKQPPTDSQPLV